MKWQHFVGIVFVAAAGGFIVYKLLNRKKTCDSNAVSSDENETLSGIKGEENKEQDNAVFNSEKKCDAAIHQTYENMSVRNEQAKQILSEIHDDMKKSEENITSKKEDIERVVESLKK